MTNFPFIRLREMRNLAIAAEKATAVIYEPTDGKGGLAAEKGVG